MPICEYCKEEHKEGAMYCPHCRSYLGVQHSEAYNRAMTILVVVTIVIVVIFFGVAFSQ